MGYVSTGMGDHFSALLVSLTALWLTETPFDLVQSSFHKSVKGFGHGTYGPVHLKSGMSYNVASVGHSFVTHDATSERCDFGIAALTFSWK